MARRAPVRARRSAQRRPADDGDPDGFDREGDRTSRPARQPGGRGVGGGHGKRRSGESNESGAGIDRAYAGRMTGNPSRSAASASRASSVTNASVAG